MKEILTKYILILLIVIAIVGPGSFLLGGLAGCARVQYKKYTPSDVCNMIIMFAQLKSIKGMSAFEIGRLEKCYEDLARIRKEKELARIRKEKAPLP